MCPTKNITGFSCYLLRSTRYFAAKIACENVQRKNRIIALMFFIEVLCIVSIDIIDIWAYTAIVIFVFHSLIRLHMTWLIYRCMQRTHTVHALTAISFRLGVDNSREIFAFKYLRKQKLLFYVRVWSVVPC